MAYTLRPVRNEFKSGKNILASEHVQFIEVGATLDATKFPEGVIPIGTLIVRNTTTGKFEPYVETTPGEFPAGYDEPAVLNIDVQNNGTDDIIVGEVIIRGSVYEGKLPQAPTDAFRAKTPMIRFIKEI